MKKTNYLAKDASRQFSLFLSDFKAQPFLKWAGGKSSLLTELLKRKPEKFNRYFEPFLGGGAFFFALSPRRAYLSDENEELINAYSAVKEEPEKLMKILSDYSYNKELYYELRELDRKNTFKRMAALKRAARFIYLNKTCFNGLYRVNSKGQFNVPFGKYSNPAIFDREVILNCAKALKGATLRSCSYERILAKVKSGDFVYLDPPYMPLNKTSNFTSYTRGGFGMAEQESLADFCKKLDNKGASFMLSNSFHPVIAEMYKGFKSERVFAPRAINSDSSKRGNVEELLVRNY